MHFYEVLVSSQRYHGKEPLTYSSDKHLDIGNIVIVPFGNQKVVGIVYKTVDVPKFDTKTIESIILSKVLPAQLLQLHNWLTDYYPGPLGFITQLFIPSGLTTTSRLTKQTEKPSKSALALPPLTSEQSAALQTLLKNDGAFLLHGETGSGKTRIYQELAKNALKSNRSALILTPEIGLTPQLAQSFQDLFPGQVVVTHSIQTNAKRRENWKRILLSEKPLVIIGPRSALFSPVTNLGLIVMDEAHDSAYKQEQMPYYQTSRVAAKLAELHNARLVLGSSTPLIQDYYVFSQKKLPIVRMQQSAIQSSNGLETTIVDLKDRQQFSRSPWLSDALIATVERALQERTQSLIFLNRRGTARLVLCKNCGWQAVCPRCDLPLTYHGDTYRLRCHTCGFGQTPPTSCPTCKATDIQFKSIGTKTIMAEVDRLFPKAHARRFDSDSHKAERLEEQYSAVQAGEIDILVGTQMLSKGLDLPKLKVVGVVIADTSLYFPDFSAEERTFQMLRQVTGRVGRGHHDATIIIQTYYPDSLTLSSVVTKDYEQFYNSQLSERQVFKFPPFYFVLKIVVERALQQTARVTAQELAQNLLKKGLKIELVGPAPSFVEKAHNKYRWQIVVKSKQRSELTKVIDLLPKNVMYDIDPTNLL